MTSLSYGSSAKSNIGRQSSGASSGGGAAINIAVGRNYTKRDYYREIVARDSVTNQRILLDLTNAIGNYHIGIYANAYVNQPLSLNASITDIILRGWSV